MEADRIAVDNLGLGDTRNRAALPVATDFGVFDALKIQFHGFGIDVTTVVKQGALAQAEDPGLEILAGLPALGQAWDDIALEVEIRETCVKDSGGIDGVVHIVLVSIETSDIAARAKF